ncbi:MAG TPA: hypothetical protein VG937_15045 [Polyangiaceae bacterium]|nr:hypothetical protein [Polyangiaceae bacterium]
MSPLALRPATVLAFALLGACRNQPTPSDSKGVASAKPRAPVDRLAPGELAPGEEALFGLLLPKGMKVQGKFDATGLAWGDLGAEDVANYVRSHVEADQVEVGAARTIFNRVAIKDGPADHTFRIEVVRESAGTRLIVRDTTPEPPAPPPTPGLSDEERWRRAGFAPNGKPLDMKALE